MELQNRIGFFLRLALIAALLAATPAKADPQMQRVVPAALTLDIGGESKLLVFSGKDLQLIKEVTVASAAADQFTLSLGPVSADGADRQLLIKANAEAAAGIYRLRILYTTRGGLLLDPRLIKLRVMPASIAGRTTGRLADSRARQAARSQRQAPVDQVLQPPRPAVFTPNPKPVAPEIASSPVVGVRNGEIPPEPEVVDDGRTIAEERLRADRDSTDSADDDSFDKAPAVVFKQLPEGSLSAAMLAEAMSEPSLESVRTRGSDTAMPRSNIVPVEANRSTRLAWARSAGDTPRLGLLGPASQKLFIRGYIAPVQAANAGQSATKPSTNQPQLIEQKPTQQHISAAVVGTGPGQISSPQIQPAQPAPERTKPQAIIAQRLSTPAPPVLLPRSRPERSPVAKPMQSAVAEPPAEVNSSAKGAEIVSVVKAVEPEVASRTNRQASRINPGAAEAAVVTGVSAGMRALPVYWIRGMAPTAMLVGAVRNAQTGEPVEGAELELGSMQAKTSAAGLYSLPSEDDSRQLKISADGYLPMHLTAPRQSGAQMDEVDVSLIPIEPVTRDKNLPDLMVVSPPTTPLCRGDKQAVRVRIFNAGRKPVKNYDVTIFSRQWRDGGSPEGVNDSPVSIDGPPLGAGETRVVDVPVTIAADSLWAEMTAEVDAKSRYDELLETNNRSNPRRIVVAALPDCKGASANLPDYAMLPSLSVVEADGEQGCQLETAVTLANYSNKAAPPVAVTLSMNSAGDLIFSESLQLRELRPAEEQALRFAAPVDALLRALSRSLSLPSLLPDQRMTLSVEVNAELEQDERFTTNNRVEFSGRLSEFVAIENLLYRKRGEACLAKL